MSHEMSGRMCVSTCARWSVVLKACSTAKLRPTCTQTKKQPSDLLVNLLILIGLLLKLSHHVLDKVDHLSHFATFSTVLSHTAC